MGFSVPSPVAAVESEHTEDVWYYSALVKRFRKVREHMRIECVYGHRQVVTVLADIDDPRFQDLDHMAALRRIRAESWSLIAVCPRCNRIGVWNTQLRVSSSSLPIVGHPGRRSGCVRFASRASSGSRIPSGWN